MDSKDFHFPFEPYDIQRQFMQQVYHAIENRQVAILESPTGTGKSLSLACAALTWLRDHQNGALQPAGSTNDDSDEPSWILEHSRQEKRSRIIAAHKARRDRIAQARKREEKLQKQQYSGSGPRKRQATADTSLFESEHDSVASFLLDDYDSDSEEVARQDTYGVSGLSARTRHMLDKVGLGAPRPQASMPSEEDIHSPTIFFCSRTHSQLAQFTAEVRRIKLPFVVDDGTSMTAATSQHDSETLRHLTLGSRKNLCINSKVSRLSSNTAINERCLEMQKAGLSDEKRCSYLPKQTDNEILDKFVDYAHAQIRDIEDLAALGKAMCICPYYASRKAIATSELVTLPYTLLLQPSSRQALGISLKDNIVIIDEAHNLMDAICGLFSCSVSSAQLRLGRDQLMTYLKKFKNMLKGNNRVYVAQCVRVLDSLLAYTQRLQSASSGGEGSCEPSSMLSGKGMDQVNMFKLIEYMQQSKLARKVDGYTEFIDHTLQSASDQRANAGPETSAQRQSGPTLNSIQAFMMALTNPSAGGSFGFDVKEDVVLKYMLLDPASHFREVVDEARAVILAGGTMSPMNDYHRFLLPYMKAEDISTLACKHIVPAASLNVFTVASYGTSTQYDFRYAARSSESAIVDAGRALIEFTTVVPDGVVAFFPSYSYLSQCLATWKRMQFRAGTTIWQALECIKPIFLERTSRDASGKSEVMDSQATGASASVNIALQQFTSSVRRGKGGLLLAVISGSLSEGINFSDELGRGVVVIGLPYPDPNGAEWKAKMEYIGKNTAAIPQGHGQHSSSAQEFYENATMRAVNQAVGRAIRHRLDYAAIMLLDKRYTTSRVQNKLPAWMKDSIQSETDVKAICERLASFFKDKRSADV